MSVSLVVPRALVKTVKTALQDKGVFARRIEKVADVGGVGKKSAEELEDVKAEEVEEVEEKKEEEKEPLFLIATTLPTSDAAAHLLADLGLPPTVTVTTTAPAPASTISPPQNQNALETAIRTYLLTLNLPPDTLIELLSTAPKRYSIYPPLLLLPSGSFTSPSWSLLLPTLPPVFFASLASAHNCTHLVVNAPIPSTSTTRAPLSLTPLYGTFTDPDLWVRTVQNGIIQTWPPARCMFSRGNVKEKARVLGFSCVRGQQVVDLYAGIGYFVFSYLKAGASRVWCWEVSAWSVDALVRGAGENGWIVEVVDAGGELDGGVEGLDKRGVRCVVFRESNEFAVSRLGKLGVKGVRHVNMGYLPDCKAVWPAAAEILREGGCAHVHANVAIGEEEGYAGEVVEGFAAEMVGDGGRVGCEHVEVVKTFAPGVVHCVFDIRIEDKHYS